MNAEYTPAEIKLALADHIIEEKVPFPFRDFPPEEIREKLARLHAVPWNEILIPKTRDYHGRLDYVRWTPDMTLGSVPLGSPYNVISRAYHDEMRYGCAGWRTPSSMEIWYTPELLRKCNWMFWRFGGMFQHLDEALYRLSMATSYYVATQFRPQVFTGLIRWLEAKTVADPSCGWGDRLAGFYGSDAHTYVGCDPNLALFDGYAKQVVDYERWLHGRTVTPTWEGRCLTFKGAAREVRLYHLPAEEVDWVDVAPEGGFDFAFTSPPYFSVEKYAEGSEHEDMQSWKRFPTFTAWRDGFFYPTYRNVFAAMSERGVVGLNIVDPRVGETRNELCDAMIEEFEKLPGVRFQGVIAMALKLKPSPKMKQVADHNLAEPIWMFAKNRTLEPVSLGGVFDLFA